MKRVSQGPKLFSILSLMAFDLVSMTTLFAQANTAEELLMEPFAGPDSLKYKYEDSAARAVGAVTTSCDPIWDGALFGILPGVAIAGFPSITGAGCGDNDSCAPRVIKGAVIGAAIGTLLDYTQCHRQEAGKASAVREEGEIW